jgi:hypothetical protein
MARGDQIYVMRPLVGVEGVYEHHGIDCGDGSVIHYRKVGEARISRTSIAEFAMGQPIYRKYPGVSFIPDVVIQRAESRLGERRYNLLFNNCEHFANWCKTGRNVSQQVENYGFSQAWINTLDSQRLLSTIATEEEDPAQVAALFQQAKSNLAIAQNRLQSQLTKAQTEANSWQRVAQTAMQRGREDLARAALYRKVEFKRQIEDLQNQLDQLEAIGGSLQQNDRVLQQRITT